MIKIFNLKGYESELYEAHSCEVKHATFIPNGGILCAVDALHRLSTWDLKTMR